MKYPGRNLVNEIRKKYPEGCRVELVRMEDPKAPPAGTRGTVKAVDDMGSLIVSWDDGSGLNVIYGEDVCVKLDAVTTICYGEKRVWDSADEAKAFFLEGAMSCDGSEQQRYMNIYTKLMEGAEEADDDE
jgi:hypothetical protein